MLMGAIDPYISLCKSGDTDGVHEANPIIGLIICTKAGNRHHSMTIQWEFNLFFHGQQVNSLLCAHPKIEKLFRLYR